MEVTGVERIFSRSIEINKLQYTEYYGGSDQQSFSAVENIYPSRKVVKKGCIGHVTTETCRFMYANGKHERPWQTRSCRPSRGAVAVGAPRAFMLLWPLAPPPPPPLYKLQNGELTSGVN